MEVNQKQAFFASLAVIAETVNRKISVVLMKAYWECLKDYSFAEVQHALGEVLKNPNAKKHPYFPLPTDVIEIIKGDVQSKSLLAWTNVTKAIREIGHYDSVIFSDTLIHAVIQDMGGWITLCQHSEKELPFVQRDFERRYQVYCRRRRYYLSNYRVVLPIKTPLMDMKNIFQLLSRFQITKNKSFRMGDKNEMH